MMYTCLDNVSGVINTTCVHSTLLQHDVSYNGPMSTLESKDLCPLCVTEKELKDLCLLELLQRTYVTLSHYKGPMSTPCCPTPKIKGQCCTQ